jgi:Icc-related predicted phosphoesterase
MPVYVVSDLHGASDPLRKAVPEDATLLLLGDLLNVIDYFEMSGILVEIFGHEPVARVNELRLSGDLNEARRIMTERADGRQDEIRELFGRLAAEEYGEVFSALPDPTHVILGNVDIPQMVATFADGAPGVHTPDGRVVEIEGERFGFVGGALPTPLHVAGEISEEDMRAKIVGLEECDVLCSHIPPAIPELCYDTLAGRPERGSEDILRYIEDVQPARHYFGHVHQPLVSSLRVGRTLCVNVGYFRMTQRAFPHKRESREDE